MKMEAAVVQSCPSCGRPMLVQLEYLDKEVQCGHCGCGCVVDNRQNATRVLGRHSINQPNGVRSKVSWRS